MKNEEYDNLDLKKNDRMRQFSFSDNDIKAFNVLGLNVSTDWKKVREKFKKLVKKLHPDKNLGNNRFEEKLKIITLAYTQLKRSFKK